MLSSKEENVLLLLNYQDLFIAYVFLNPAYLAAFLFGLRISALFNGFVIYIPAPIQAMVCLRMISL